MDRREPSMAERAAIESVWIWYCHSKDSRDIAFTEVVQRVQSRCSGADVELIKSEFGRRLRRAQRLA